MKLSPQQNVHSTPVLFPALAILIACLISAPALFGQAVPDSINYQGILLKGDGTPVPAVPTDIEFRIYDNPAESTGLIWGRMFRVTPDANGAFNVVLSSEGAVLSGAPDVSLASVFTGNGSDSRYLELTVAGSTPIRPRQRFVASAYAFLAHDVTHARQNFSIAGVLTVGGPASFSSLAASGGAAVSGLATVGSLATTGSVNAASVNAGDRVVTPVLQAAAAANGSLEVTNNANVAGSVTASNFVGYGTIPIGGIIMWSGTNVPAGWALCDGTKGTPNLSGRFVLSGPLTQVKATGGAANVTLAVANLPLHTHTMAFSTVGYSASYNSSSETTGAPYNGRNSGTQWRTSDGTGSGSAFSILPPYYVLAYIMRIQ
jgi:microcystin-dependent protein